MQQISSVAELVKAFDGPTAIAKVLKTTPQNVVNWRKARRIPARLHRAHKELLARAGIDALDSLWGFIPVRQLAVKQRQREESRAKAVA